MPREQLPSCIGRRSVIILVVLSLLLGLLVHQRVSTQVEPSRLQSALVLYALHSCGLPETASQWANAIMFLKYGGVVKESAMFDTIDYAIIFSKQSAKKVRLVHRHRNVRVFEVPGFYADLQSFGCVAMCLRDTNLFDTYSHFFWLNSGTRGPFFEPATWRSFALQFNPQRAQHFNWLDVAAGNVPRFSIPPESKATSFLITPSVSWEISFHAQSYFMSMPSSTAKMLLAHYADPAPRSKDDAIIRLEVGATSRLLSLNILVFDLNRRRFVHKNDTDSLLGISNPYMLDGFVDPYEGLFVKYRRELAPSKLNKIILHHEKVSLLPTSSAELYETLQQKFRTRAQVSDWCTTILTEDFLVSFDGCRP